VYQGIRSFIALMSQVCNNKFVLGTGAVGVIVMLALTIIYL
jgi:hypothetical protein